MSHLKAKKVIQSYYPSASKTASEFVPFGGTPETLQFTVRDAYSTGQGGRITIPKDLLDLYKYFTVTGYVDYCYYDSSYFGVSSGTKYTINNYSHNNGLSFTNKGGLSYPAYVTLSET